MGVKPGVQTTGKPAATKVVASGKPAIFVAYPYSISKADYRGAFKKVA